MIAQRLTRALTAMDDVAFDHLERAIEIYGPVLFQDRQESLSAGWQTTGNVLRDLCGERCGPDKHGPEISALVQAVVEKVPAEIASEPHRRLRGYSALSIQDIGDA